MNDVCLACGKPIFTINAGMGRAIITLAQRWTHGKRRWDRNHIPIPSNHDYKIVGQ
jgi:hypothetical protein